MALKSSGESFHVRHFHSALNKNVPESVGRMVAPSGILKHPR